MRARALELCGGDDQISAGRLPHMLGLAAQEAASRSCQTRNLHFAEIFSGPSFYRTCDAV